MLVTKLKITKAGTSTFIGKINDKTGMANNEKPNPVIPLITEDKSITKPVKIKR